VDSCATTATSLSDTQKQLESQLQLQSTCAFTIDRIDSITPSGREEVFDIEVERTGNFIANGVVSHNTRWSLLDLTQRLINFSTQNEGADEWEVVQLPAILPSGRSLWPAQWPVEQLLAKKAAIDPQYWNAQYMQDPTSEEGAIVKREWWKTWEKVKPPKCQYIIQAIDPAFTKTSTSDPTAHITVGVWIDEEDKDTPKIMLLNAFAERMEFPELKAVALKHYKEWEPDAFIIEAKASGWPLIFELRAMGIPVQDFTPSRGNDKITRLNSVADLFRSGMVYAPDTRWAREVIEQFAAFPSGDHDDLVDALVMALMRFRQGGFVSTTQDEKEDKMLRLPRARGFYAPV
jgi:predicted phage terminase large subunit-like protein